jgi:hypothetical protein
MCHSRVYPPVNPKCGVSHGFPTMSVDHVPRKTHGFSTSIHHARVLRPCVGHKVWPPRGTLWRGGGLEIFGGYCSHVTMDMMGILD